MSQQIRYYKQDGTEYSFSKEPQIKIKTSIESFMDNDYSVKIPNLIMDFGNAKLHFDKPLITIDELFDVYLKLQNYLNTHEGFKL